MKIAAGRIVEGKVVLEGEPLAERSVVTVVAREDDEAFDVSLEVADSDASPSLDVDIHTVAAG